MLVESRFFQLLATTMILANAVFVGVSSDHQVRKALSDFDARVHGSEVLGTPAWIASVDLFFTFAFTLELCFRLVAQEGRLFMGPDWKWNSFDLALVVSSLVDLTVTSVSANMKHVRTFRVFRIFRSFRIFTLLRGASSLFHKLRLMLLAILISAVPFFWAVIILLMFVFIFSVIFVDGVATHISDAVIGDPDVDQLRTFFGSMSMALLTLLMSVLGGVSWWEVIEPLMKVNTMFGILFVTFVLVTVLAAMNIITGVFVNDSLEAASMDKDLVIQMDMEDNRNLLLKLRAVFSKMDEDGGGTITAEEFNTHIQSDEVKHIFNQLGLDAVDAEKFFAILDTDGNSMLEIEEFVMGCMRFKSKGKTIDIESAVLESKLMSKKVIEMQVATRESLNRLEGLVFAVWERASANGQTSYDDGVFSDDGMHLDDCASAQVAEKPLPLRL